MAGFDDLAHPTRDDPVVAALSERVGGPLGRHAAGHRWWTPVRVVLALCALCLALGMVQKAPCYRDGWEDATVRYSAMCYSDLPYLYTGRGFAELSWPYDPGPRTRARYQVMEYPPGISYWAWGTAWVTQRLAGSPDLAARGRLPPDRLAGQPDVAQERRLYVAVNAVGLGLLALLAAYLLTGVTPRRPWDAAAFAVSPTLALAGLVNWDLVAAVLVAGALWAWARGRPVLTGVLIGVGTATKLYPLFLLGGVLVICLRERRWSTLARTGTAAAAAWAATNAPAYLTGADEWRVFWTFNADRGPDWGSPWLVLAQAADLVIDPVVLNWTSWALFGAWCLAVLAAGVRAPATPTLAQLGFLVVAGFLLVNKVYSPQYVLWLLPLAALARPRWRDQLVWQATEVFYFAAIWWNLGGFLAPAAGDDAVVYWLAIGARMAGELYLVGLVLHDIGRGQVTTTRSNWVAV